MQPLFFTPYLRPAVWGGRRLHEVLGKGSPQDGVCGESWEISTHPAHVSQVTEGPLAGTSLSELCATHGRELFGEAPSHSSFPLLIKYLDACDWLSVQVHPDDEKAPRLAGERLGKTEAWVVLDTQPEARIYAGLKAEIGRADLERALAERRVAECLHVFKPRPGDCLFLPAGTVHAVGGGVLMAEVQQSSDATLRLYDWDRPGSDGRPRPLHLPQALDAIDWQRGPVEPVTARASQTDANVQVEGLVECPYFRLHRFRATDAFAPSAQQLSIWLVIEGQVVLQASAGYRRLCRRGDTVLIPAAAKDVQWTPEPAATLLCVRLP